jgi:hypothetical protein
LLAVFTPAIEEAKRQVEAAIAEHVAKRQAHLTRSPFGGALIGGTAARSQS